MRNAVLLPQLWVSLKDFFDWKDFDLNIMSVQFVKSCLEMSEWKFLTPTVRRDSPPHSR